jgi:acyl carrier protein
MKVPTWTVLGAVAGICLLGCVPRLRLRLDPWLSRRQKRNLRALPARLPLDCGTFISRMQVDAADECVVAAVRHRVAEEASYHLGEPVSSQAIYPQDQIVADLGIDAGPDLGGAVIFMALEKDLIITLPDQEAETVYTVEDLVHLCQRHRGVGTRPRTSQT